MAHVRRGTRYYLSLSLLTFCILSPSAEAASHLPSVGGNVAVLIDPSSTLTLQDVLTPARQAEFRPVSGQNINFGYIAHAVWLRLTLPAPAYAEGLLSLTPNFVDTIDIYVAKPGDGSSKDDFTLHEVGDHRPLPHDSFSGLDNAVRLEFAAGEKTIVYIRLLNTNSFTQMNLRLETIQGHTRSAAVIGGIYGAWFGGMSVLFVIHLVFFCFDRKRQYLLVALSTLGVMLVYAGNLGLSHVLLFRGTGWANDLFLGFNAWMGLAFSVLACSSLLDLRKKSIWLHSLYLACAATGIVGMGFALAGRNLVFGPVGSSVSMLAAIVNLLLGLRYLNEEGAVSRLRAAAFTAVAIGVLISLGDRLGFDLLPQWSYHAYGVSGLIMTILLTGSLAVWLRKAEVLSLAQATERRVAEEALQAEMQSQLRQVRFLEVVSHQYRASLAAIRSSIDSIGLSLAKSDKANHDRITRIRRSVAQLVEVLETNLARSRLQGPAFRVRLAPATAGSIVVAAHQRSRDLLTGPEINLHIAPDAADIKLAADADMLELAILNLLENAVKYAALKGASPIALSLDKTTDGIAITVTDHGIGIPERDLPHVFENSVRGSNAKGADGSGLGLFLVAKIATAHGGSATVQSREGEGTTVRINLPAREA
ncbi:sensor histidine kinase [Bradyrhizobium neotropicale]|uniref:sensor histidine kinase n=1 Tax=Bradyrhizobium neotropicale TaxID=1497615 RepID=UPI001AD6336A|nr:sensor histidine kinase [Bradyrhizobium neotropicale]MBO4225103.1 hypothetical protein [Bradyrhizobium neotropicale]